MLTSADIVKDLFKKLDTYLRDYGFQAMKGQSIDVTLIAALEQRNSRKENKQIKEGKQPQNWSKNMQSQKDTDARWTRGNYNNYFRYKNHVNLDVKNKLIRDYEITTTSVHDSNVFEELLDFQNTSHAVWADSTY